MQALALLQKFIGIAWISHHQNINILRISQGKCTPFLPVWRNNLHVIAQLLQNIGHIRKQRS